MAERWGIDMAQALRHAETSRAQARRWRACGPRCSSGRRRERATDVDEDLYGGFVGNDDRRTLQRLRALPPRAAGRQAHRLRRRAAGGTAVPLPRAQLPGDAERRPSGRAGSEHRAARLHDGAGGALTLQAFFDAIDALNEEADERGQAILGALYDYASRSRPSVTEGGSGQPQRLARRRRDGHGNRRASGARLSGLVHEHPVRTRPRDDRLALRRGGMPARSVGLNGPGCRPAAVPA